MKDNRPHRISFRVNDEELALIEKKSEKFNDRSEFIRKACVRVKINVPAPAVDRDAAMRLARIGNNINQIAYSLNKAEMNIMNRKVLKELRDNIEILQNTLDETRNSLRTILANR